MRSTSKAKRKKWNDHDGVGIHGRTMLKVDHCTQQSKKTGYIQCCGSIGADSGGFRSSLTGTLIRQSQIHHNKRKHNNHHDCSWIPRSNDVVAYDKPINLS